MRILFCISPCPPPSCYGPVCVQQWVKLDSPVSRLSLFTEKSQSIMKIFSHFGTETAKIGNSTLILCVVIWEICKFIDINVSNILSIYASTVKYFTTFHVLLNYVSPIIKFADLHKACQTSKGWPCPVAPPPAPPSGCATRPTDYTV